MRKSWLDVVLRPRVRRYSLLWRRKLEPDQVLAMWSGANLLNHFRNLLGSAVFVASLLCDAIVAIAYLVEEGPASLLELLQRLLLLLALASAHDRRVTLVGLSFCAQHPHKWPKV